MRLRYRRRRDTLIQALATTSPRLRVTGGAAGLNLLVPLSNAHVEADTLAAARAAGIGLDGLVADGYCVNDDRAGLIVGYAAAPGHAFHGAVETLAAVFERVPAPEDAGNRT